MTDAEAPEALRALSQRDIDAGRTPGMQFVAVDAAGVIAEFFGGWADLRERRPMAPRTMLMAYSMTKTVTAIAALQLIERGRIALDAPVATYVPASPYGERVTVRDLLAHTGGLPAPIPLRWVHRTEEHASFDEAAALARVWRAHPKLAREPGTRFAYSNIGYWMLGRVIEQAAGESFAAWVEREIVLPLGLTAADATFVLTEGVERATGYVERWSPANLLARFLIDRALLGGYDGRWRRIARHYANGPAFGGMIGTARAFGALLRDQLQQRSALLGDDARRLLYEQQAVRGPAGARDGAAIPMTLGWHIAAATDGSPIYFKEGGGAGFHCLMRLYPSRGLGAVIMTNATGYDVHRALDAAVDAVAG